MGMNKINNVAGSGSAPHPIDQIAQHARELLKTEENKLGAIRESLSSLGEQTQILKNEEHIAETTIKNLLRILETTAEASGIETVNPTPTPTSSRYVV